MSERKPERCALLGLGACLAIVALAIPVRAEQFDQLADEKCPNGAIVARLTKQIGVPHGVIRSESLRSLFRRRSAEFRRCAASTAIPFLHDGALVFSLRDASSGLETNGDVLREDPGIIAASKRLAATTRFANIRSVALSDAAQVQADLIRARKAVGK
jgi:hypothetical protein